MSLYNYHILFWFNVQMDNGLYAQLIDIYRDE